MNILFPLWSRRGAEVGLFSMASYQFSVQSVGAVVTSKCVLLCCNAADYTKVINASRSSSKFNAYEPSALCRYKNPFF